MTDIETGIPDISEQILLSPSTPQPAHTSIEAVSEAGQGTFNGLSILYSIPESDEDDELSPTLYKMQIEPIDNKPYCVICLSNTATPYGCFQCKECIICEECIEKLNPKHRKKCPVCRKGRKWCKIIETNKAYILINNEDEVIRENNRIMRAEHIINRRRDYANVIFCRAAFFVSCVFAPFIVFMGLKFVE